MPTHALGSEGFSLLTSTGAIRTVLKRELRASVVISTKFHTLTSLSALRMCRNSTLSSGGCSSTVMVVVQAAMGAVLRGESIGGRSVISEIGRLYLLSSGAKIQASYSILRAFDNEEGARVPPARSPFGCITVVSLVTVMATTRAALDPLVYLRVVYAGEGVGRI
ncbi:hypothetical protein V5O48_014493 [Marasmius crinis-equi]|uniref:Uncharacterized protein n=1 Tax=Marasmius crinis-equi TaxID=585013 RepID=A0ABR3EX55_9AGAR